MDLPNPPTSHDIDAHFLALSKVPARGDGKPEWLKVRMVGGELLFDIKRKLRRGSLHTVCEEAHCPNISECLNAGTATFMILGDVCTRGCRFCNVQTGNPQGALNANEPATLAATVRDLAIDYVVLTMVDRDDLDDGGAAHIAATVRSIRAAVPEITIEILTGDFRGQEAPLRTVVESGIDVFAHNVECVDRITPRVRDVRASYRQSLDVLSLAKKLKPGMMTKSGLILGLGERPAEVAKALADMRSADVDIVTIGQYLRPTPRHLAVDRYAHPEEFDFWQRHAESIGFRGAASGPLVRSSYRAAHLFPRRQAKH